MCQVTAAVSITLSVVSFLNKNNISTRTKDDRRESYLENFHVLPSSLRSWLWKYNTRLHHCFKVKGGSVKYPPWPFVWKCAVICSVTGMQENHMQPRSKSTVPLTTQYNIPTEVAILFPIIKKSFNGKVRSHIQLREAVYGENFSQKLQLVHSTFPGSICWKM